MTRSTHIKSRKPRNKKQGTRKQGTRKPQSGGGYFDWLPSFNLTKEDSTNQQSKDEVLKQRLTSALKDLSNLLSKVEICAKASDVASDVAKEEAKVAAADAVMPATRDVMPATQVVPRDQLIGGGSKSSRKGRGRAPPKGGPKGGPKGKKGMMVGPRKGPIIF